VSTTGSRATRILGVAALVGLGLLLAYAFVWSPADVNQKDAVRLMYIHVPAAICMELTCLGTTVASLLWLRKRTRGWDVLASSMAEVCLLLTGITLLTGSLWGRPTWGTYWTWDPRLTSTALLAILLVGYLALRNLPADPDVRATRASIVGLLLTPNALLVHYSVDWWQSLHQKATITRFDPTIEGTMLFTLVLGIGVLFLIVAWLLVHRFRVGWLAGEVDRHELDAAIAERRAEVMA
jgi:heme exporter protein C